MNEVRASGQRFKLFTVHPRHKFARAAPALRTWKGNMRGPSTQDCEKSFARTGVPSVELVVEEKFSCQPGADRVIQLWRRYRLAGPFR